MYYSVVNVVKVILYDYRQFDELLYDPTTRESGVMSSRKVLRRL